MYQFNAFGLVSQVCDIYTEMLTCGVLPNVFTHNVLVHAWCKMGNLILALDLLKNVDIEADTVTYNTIIWGFCQQGLANQAFGFLSIMVKKDTFFDSITCNTLVKGYCRIGLVKYGEWVMGNLVGGGICKDIIGFNTLIDGYCKTGEMSCALNLMEKNEGRWCAA